MSPVDETPIMNKARFIYNTPEDYEPIYINGVYGGLTPRGELLAHFFYEYAGTLEQESYNIVENMLDDESKKVIHRNFREENEIVYQRDLKVGIIIPASQIQSMINWMQEKLDILVESQKRIQEADQNADVENA